MKAVRRYLRHIFVLALALAACAAPLQSGAAPSGCVTIYATAGWVIEQCAIDANVPASMAVTLDGADHGQAALVRISHHAEVGLGVPQVAIIYASGFVRLKQNADQNPSIPFGSSFVLGPAYWSSPTIYYHNPQLRQLSIDTTWLPDGTLRMRAAGKNGAFEVAYELVLPPPRDRQARLHVTQTFTATKSIAIDATRRAEHQGFKLAQVSSMFVTKGALCNGGRIDCHDSDAFRFVGADGARRQVAFDTLTPPGFIVPAPPPLGAAWLDVLHSDDAGWQGNTPNVRIVLDALPTDRTITPQGWVDATTDPAQDNVGVWLHDDGPAAAAWQAGESAQISYWLLAQDDPPDPWADLGLRPGQTFLDFEGQASCFPVVPGSGVSATVTAVAGYSDTAFQLNYNLGSDNSNWAQIRCNFDPPLNLSAYDHLRIEWRGAAANSNSLQVGLVNPTSGGEHIFARGYHHVTHHDWWGQLIMPFTFLAPWIEGASFDPGQVSAVFISVVKDPQDDAGGAGSLALDNLGAFNVASRRVPASFDIIHRQPRAAAAAAAWLATRQRPNGLLKSWEGDRDCLAYTYDQALALIVFNKAGMWQHSDSLANALVTTQNADGSWFQARNCDTLVAVGTPPAKWEGDIAWATYALSRYLALGGYHPDAITARDRAADWLEGRLSPTDGCPQIDHTEATIDTWWALHAAGRASAADRLSTCLLTSYWDNQTGRFKGGKQWWQPYLDNQTWGAAFLAAIGETEKAHRALSYAHSVLLLPSQGGQIFGFDGQGGPWSVWNEGTAQYISLGGAGSADLLRELLAQQRADGAMRGSPDDFSGGGVWTTRWAGVAPTAWLYNAISCEPFTPGVWAGCVSSWLPLVRARP